MRQRHTMLTLRTVALAGLSLLASSLAMTATQAQRPALTASPIAPHPSTQEPGHRMTFEQVVGMEQSFSNWGRWGKDDERGTLNLVTPEKTKQALRLVKDGTVISLARFAKARRDAWRARHHQLRPSRRHQLAPRCTVPLHPAARRQGGGLQRPSVGHRERLFEKRHRPHGSGFCDAGGPRRHAAAQGRRVARSACADLCRRPRGMGEICQCPDR